VYQQGDIAKVGEYRSAIAVPMRKDGRPIGAIALTRQERGPFPRHQTNLLKTFADQAVIAIENTRLFEEVQAQPRSSRQRQSAWLLLTAQSRGDRQSDRRQNRPQVGHLR